MNTQKGFAPIVALLIVLGVIIVGGVGYTFMKKSEVTENKPAIQEAQLPKEEAQQPKDETVDWNTYRNEKYGFEVKYPTSADYLLDLGMASSESEFKLNVYHDKNNISYEPPRLLIQNFPDVSQGAVDIESKNTNTFSGDNSVGKIYEGENPIRFTLSNRTVYANCVNYAEQVDVIGFCNKVLATFKFTQ